MNIGLEPYEIEELLGGGSSKTRQTHYSKQILDRFHKAGWNRSFLKNNFQHLRDDMLEGWQPEAFVREYAKYLLRKEAQMYPSRRLAQLFVGVGLHKRLAGILENIFLPLVGNSYTLPQVLDDAVEYLLGKYKPLTPPNILIFWNHH